MSISQFVKPSFWALMLFLLPSMAWACAEKLSGPSRQSVRSGDLQIVFAPSAWPIAVGKHFSLDLYVCPPAGAEPPHTLQVDAEMPAHRHGMNYKASVKSLGAGRYSVQGMMFHMPGQWRFLFDVPSVSGKVRVTRDLEVQ